MPTLHPYMLLSDPLNLLDDTAHKLRNRPSHIRLRTIAQECQVSQAWLSKLQNGVIVDAKFSMLQTVNNWLSTNV